MTILEDYYNKRLSMLMKKTIEQLSGDFAIVSNVGCIMHVFNEHRHEKTLPVEQRFVRHLFKIIFNDGKEILAGARQLLSHGFPKAFVRNLEKARRIIDNDIRTVQSLDKTTLEFAKKRVKEQIILISETKFLLGLAFLYEYIFIIEAFFAEKLSLPAWLYKALSDFSENACAFSASTEKQGIEKYLDIFTPLDSINKGIFGRSERIRRLLAKIKGNKILYPQEIDDAEAIVRTYADATALFDTERAFPFLFALHVGILATTDKNKNFLESLWRQVNGGKALSVSQLTALRNIFLPYKQQWKALPPEVTQSSDVLIQHLRMLLGKEMLTEEEKNKYDKVVSTLSHRGIAIDLFLDQIHESTDKKKGESK